MFKLIDNLPLHGRHLFLVLFILMVVTQKMQYAVQGQEGRLPYQRMAKLHRLPFWRPLICSNAAGRGIARGLRLSIQTDVGLERGHQAPDALD